MSAIHNALSAVFKGILAHGIAKARHNKEQNFRFRGIDDALAAFAPLLAANHVLLIPSYSNRVVEPRQTKSGGTTYNVSIEGTFTFVATEDGSSVVVGPFFGEANDGQDKAVSKATSVALRNMLFLTFVVPHEPAIGGDPDGQAEEDAPSFDIQPWLDVIAASDDMDALHRAGAELKTAIDKMPPNAARNIRAMWAKRANELKVAK